MKRLLILGCIIILGTALVCGAYVAVLEFSPDNRLAQLSGATSVSPAPEEIALYDVDAMAERMPAHKEYYIKLRDEALGAYSSGNPSRPAYNDEAKAAIQLGSYYLTWSDFYGEGVLRDLAIFEQMAEHKGCSNPMLCNLDTAAWDDTHYPTTDARAVEICNEMKASAQSNSPVAFKLWFAQTAVITTLNYNKQAKSLQANTQSMQMLPKVISSWEKSLAQLIKEKAPVNIIYEMPSKLMDDCQCDEATMNLVIAAIDHAYNEAGLDGALRVALDGEYFTNMAWAARGSGYANTVSDQQSLLFQQRLRQAHQILEDAYTKYPDEPTIPTLMLTVALGESLDRDTMEMWFQRTIKVDPNNFHAYANKAWYLQPRWYGTVDEEMSFVRECVATQNWTFNIPIVLAAALDEVADNGDQDIFAHEEIWKLTESTYTKYLELYPRSTKYRTYFLRAAYLGHHQEVMAEQYKILGKNWDPLILGDDEYTAIASSLGH